MANTNNLNTKQESINQYNTIKNHIQKTKQITSQNNNKKAQNKVSNNQATNNQ